MATRLHNWMARKRDKTLYKLPIGLIEHPFEVWIGILCVVTGPLLIAGGPAATPDTLDDLLPEAMVYVWAIFVLLSGVAILLGKFTAWFHFERVGMALIGAVTFVYSVALMFSIEGLGGAGAVFAIGTYVTFTAAAAIRYMVLGHTIDRVRESQK